MTDVYIYQGEYLNQFPKSRRSAIAQQFYAAVRAGDKNLECLIAYVYYKAVHRIYHAENQNKPDEIALWRQVVHSLKTEGAKEFAEFVLKREAMPYQDRDRLKAEQGKQYQKEWMAGQPATEKQIAYLEKLGCPRRPQSKLEALELIEEYLNH